jgi:hypothetical protein
VSSARYFECLGRFNEAWQQRDAPKALEQARAIRDDGGELQIHDAMRLTILLGRDRHPLFEAAAKRWIARLSEEGRSLVEVQIATAAIGGLPSSAAGERCETVLIRLMSSERSQAA